MQRVSGTFVALALLSGARLASGDTITEYTAVMLVDTGGFYGQEVPTGSGGPWDDITFRFLSESPKTSSETPFASGTIFLLDKEYLGAPQDLSSSTSGFVAVGTANAAGTAWDFDPSIILQPNTNYWFYESTSQPPNVVTNVQTGPSNELFYFASTSTDSFTSETGPNDFRLSGAPVAPEPSSFILFGMAVSGLGVARWRKRKQAA